MEPNTKDNLTELADEATQPDTNNNENLAENQVVGNNGEIIDLDNNPDSVKQK